MRLIDADALLLHLADYQLQESPDWGANGYGNKDAYEAITECIRAVEEATTIDAVPLDKEFHTVIRDPETGDYDICKFTVEQMIGIYTLEYTPDGVYPRRWKNEDKDAVK